MAKLINLWLVNWKSPNTVALLAIKRGAPVYCAQHRTLPLGGSFRRSLIDSNTFKYSAACWFDYSHGQKSKAARSLDSQYYIARRETYDIDKPVLYSLQRVGTQGEKLFGKLIYTADHFKKAVRNRRTNTWYCSSVRRSASHCTRSYRTFAGTYVIFDAKHETSPLFSPLIRLSVISYLMFANFQRIVSFRNCENCMSDFYQNLTFASV